MLESSKYCVVYLMDDNRGVAGATIKASNEMGITVINLVLPLPKLTTPHNPLKSMALAGIFASVILSKSPAYGMMIRKGGEVLGNPRTRER